MTTMLGLKLALAISQKSQCMYVMFGFCEQNLNPPPGQHLLADKRERPKEFWQIKISIQNRTCPKVQAGGGGGFCYLLA